MKELRIPALEIRQGRSRRIYSFGIDGKLLHRFATVSRISRDDSAALSGYQRPEVMSHIQAIRTYIESESPLLPNGIVVAFDKRVRFEPDQSPRAAPGVRTGTLTVPLDAKERPGWIVDGQQRAAALRDARVSRFPIFVSAFITEEIAEQRAQFILVNATKPLPRGLIHELLPATDMPLPPALHRKRLPAVLLEHLNYDPDSPLQGRIRTPTAAGGVIKDNSILKMLENSLSDGALYVHRYTDHGVPDLEGMLGLLKAFWTAASEVFADAWDLPPRRSRLTHGIGIVSLGYLMDAIAEEFDEIEPEGADFVRHLQLIERHCAWTRGSWRLGRQRRAWNDVQNTPRDVQQIADHLLGAYRRELRNLGPAQKRSRAGGA
jgi:DGQHR domain-containing protein